MKLFHKIRPQSVPLPVVPKRDRYTFLPLSRLLLVPQTQGRKKPAEEVRAGKSNTSSLGSLVSSCCFLWLWEMFNVNIFFVASLEIFLIILGDLSHPANTSKLSFGPLISNCLPLHRGITQLVAHCPLVSPLGEGGKRGATQLQANELSCLIHIGSTSLSKAPHSQPSRLLLQATESAPNPLAFSSLNQTPVHCTPRSKGHLSRSLIVFLEAPFTTLKMRRSKPLHSPTPPH